MKKILITAVLAAMPFIVSAQTTAFDKFQDVEGIETVVINKKMFDMIGNVEMSAEAGKAQKFVDMAKGLEYVKIFSTSDKKHRKNLVSTVESYLKQNPLDELMSFNSEESKIKVYVNKGDSSIIKECLVFVQNDDDKEVVVMSMTGNIDLKDLGDLKDLKK